MAYLGKTPASVSLVGLSFIEDAAQQEFGVPLHQVSALHLVLRWDRIQVLLDPSTPHFSVQGGNQQLIHSLLERVAGVIPDYLVRNQYKLIKVVDRGFIFECRFKTPIGEELLFAKNVIFALPELALTQVAGIESLPLSESRKEFLKRSRRAAHTKILITAEGMGDLPSNFLSSKGQGRWVRGLQLPKDHPAFSSAQKIRLETLIDEEAKTSNQLRTQEFMRDLAKWGNAEKKASFGADSLLVNWALKEGRGLSKSYLAPGDWSLRQNLTSAAEIENRMTFASEGESLYYAGTVEGAIRSGLEAVKPFIS